MPLTQPLLYDMYVGQYKRNGQVKAEEIPLSQVLIDQINSNENEEALDGAKKKYRVEHKHGFYNKAATEKWYAN